MYAQKYKSMKTFEELAPLRLLLLNLLMAKNLDTPLMKMLLGWKT